MTSLTYQNIVDLIRIVATAVNPSGTFVHARRSDGSLEYPGAMPQIHLYPFNISGNEGRQTELLIGFWQQDSPESSNEEREAIIAEMDILCREFLATLDDNYDTIQLTNIVSEPNYRQLAGTLSGYTLKFTLIGSLDCADIPNPPGTQCPTLCEQISNADAEQIDNCMNTTQRDDMIGLICPIGGSCEYDVYFNGVLQGSITVTGCEEININLT